MDLEFRWASSRACFDEIPIGWASTDRFRKVAGARQGIKLVQGSVIQRI
jgi:hypothetical protein